nr:PREDICTED: putative uncharacterized protein C16orf47 homolog [Equus przewalskii]
MNAMLNNNCWRFLAALGCSTLQGPPSHLHSCPDALHTEPALHGQWLPSSAPTQLSEDQGPPSLRLGALLFPIHHRGPAISPVDAQLWLDVSVLEQRCSSCYLGRLWPQKYLVSSHSVKWN